MIITIYSFVLLSLSVPEGQRSRIDKIYIPTLWCDKIKQTTHIPFEKSDHKAVILVLKFQREKWGNSYWKFHLLALNNVFSTKSEEQEVNIMWPNLFLIFDCSSSVYTAQKSPGRIYHRHSNSGPPFFLIWSLPRLCRDFNKGRHPAICRRFKRVKSPVLN
jgi:hypothetical protein